MSSPATWYIRKNGVVHGPASVQDIQHLLHAHQITLDEEASETQNGPWQPLGKFTEFAPVRPIAELFNAAPQEAPASSAPVSVQARSNVSPTAERLLASVLNDDAPATPGSLSASARLEFSGAVFKETEKLIENRCFPWAISLGGLTLILLAAVNMIFALIAGAVVAGITYKGVQFALGSKYLDPIEKMSDTMLVTRYNELKADQRAAKTRSAIGWAVIAIIGVILLIAFAAARSSR